jgi:hypothetical protein
VYVRLASSLSLSFHITCTSSSVIVSDIPSLQLIVLYQYSAVCFLAASSRHVNAVSVRAGPAGMSPPLRSSIPVNTYPTLCLTHNPLFLNLVPFAYALFAISVKTYFRNGGDTPDVCFVYPLRPTLHDATMRSRFFTLAVCYLLRLIHVTYHVSPYVISISLLLPSLSIVR